MERRVRTDLFGDPWFTGLERDAQYLYLFLLTGQCLPNTQFINMTYQQIADKLKISESAVSQIITTFKKELPIKV